MARECRTIPKDLSNVTVRAFAEQSSRRVRAEAKWRRASGHQGAGWLIEGRPLVGAHDETPGK